LETSAAQPVQSALNFQLKIKPGHVNDVARLLQENQAMIYGSISQIGTVHFLRFLFLPWPLTDKSNTLFIITSYDGDFDVYIAQFTYHLTDLFNTLFPHMDPAPPLPVQEHVQEAIDFVREHNIPTPLYSAYPQCTVMSIWSRGCAKGGGQ
jgi:hypothetical protein